MTRLLLGLVAVVLLSSCSSTDDPASGRADEKRDAAAFKQHMDTEAQELLPDLVSELGGLPQRPAGQLRRAWRVRALGLHRLGSPQPSARGHRRQAGHGLEVLEQHGYTVERDEAHLRVSATKDDIGVTVQAGMPTTDPDVRSVSVRIANVGALEDGDDSAASTPPEDYLAYLD